MSAGRQQIKQTPGFITGPGLTKSAVAKLTNLSIISSPFFLLSIIKRNWIYTKLINIFRGMRQPREEYFIILYQIPFIDSNE